PEVFLFPKIFTNRYCFIEKVKKETKFSTVNLIYDRKENELYEYVLYNGDYSNARKINMADIGILNDEVIFYQRIEAYELVDARNNGNLKGVLRNIAVGLNEESNPIIMLVKDKY
ncbi:6-bladed beta-propeller, partial [Bacteroides thetaiotaomicron]|nr:6-bladed beta-propeller [Bacteroides thetaiotaomicron]